MSRPLVTLIRESLAIRLKEDEQLNQLTAGRIFLNRFEEWDEAELTIIGVYSLGEEPIETNINPRPNERRMSVHVELLTTEDSEMEERLDLMAALVEDALTLPELGAIIERLGGQDTLLAIEWVRNERGFAPEARRTVGANVMTFALEYQLPAERPTLDDFRQAHTDWKAESAEGELVAEDLLDLPGWD